METFFAFTFFVGVVVVYWYLSNIKGYLECINLSLDYLQDIKHELSDINAEIKETNREIEGIAEKIENIESTVDDIRTK